MCVVDMNWLCQRLKINGNIVNPPPSPGGEGSGSAGSETQREMAKLSSGICVWLPITSAEMSTIAPLTWCSQPEDCSPTYTDSS